MVNALCPFSDRTATTVKISDHDLAIPEAISQAGPAADDHLLMMRVLHALSTQDTKIDVAGVISQRCRSAP